MDVVRTLRNACERARRNRSDDMLRDITASGVVGDATRARVETGERIVAALVPRIVQVCKEMANKEGSP